MKPVYYSPTYTIPATNYFTVQTDARNYKGATEDYLSSLQAEAEQSRIWTEENAKFINFTARYLDDSPFLDRGDVAQAASAYKRVVEEERQAFQVNATNLDQEDLDTMRDENAQDSLAQTEELSLTEPNVPPKPSKAKKANADIKERQRGVADDEIPSEELPFTPVKRKRKGKRRQRDLREEGMPVPVLPSAPASPQRRTIVMPENSFMSEEEFYAKANAVAALSNQQFVNLLLEAFPTKKASKIADELMKKYSGSSKATMLQQAANEYAKGNEKVGDILAKLGGLSRSTSVRAYLESTNFNKAIQRAMKEGKGLAKRAPRATAPRAKRKQRAPRAAAKRKIGKGIRVYESENFAKMRSDLRKMAGIIRAGNDSPSVRADFKALANYLKKAGRLSTSDYNKLRKLALI